MLKQAHRFIKKQNNRHHVQLGHHPTLLKASMTGYRRWFALCAPITLTALCHADALPNSNQHPLLQLYGLPDHLVATAPERGHWHNSWLLDAANFSNQSSANGETLLLDGEIARLAVTAHYAFTDNSSLRLQVEALHLGGGFLDHSIESWHSTFGFPNGNRNQRPQNVSSIRYHRDGAELLAVDSHGIALADTQISYHYQLNRAAPIHSSLQLSLKIPTGEQSTLTGSGSTDLDLSWAFKLHRPEQARSTFYGHLGILAMSDNGALSAYRRDAVVHASIGGQILPWPSLGLSAQISTHSAFYDSALEDLGQTAAQLQVGASLYTQRQHSLTFYISEDIAVNTAPDIVIGLRHEWRP